MLRISVLSQMFLCFFVVCNLKNNEKIELMKIKKCCAGAKWRARWDQNHLFFYLALVGVINSIAEDNCFLLWLLITKQRRQ